MIIFLIGMPGSGKTTVGKALAAKLEVPFFDLDSMIEEDVGRTISDIFENEGEDQFRKLEHEALKSIEIDSGVVASGGGAPCYHDNISLMNERGITVFLKVEIETLVKRIENYSHRPLVEGKKDLYEYLIGLYKKRLPFYEKASISVFADNPEVVGHILMQIKS